MMNFTFLLFFSLVFTIVTPKLDAIQISNFKLAKCSPNDYPVTVNNVILTTSGSQIQYSGSLNSKVDLKAPIKASLTVKCHEGIWIEVPCIHGKGSCTYDDLCKFGVPENKICPLPFTESDVPCRCPIKKGNYTIAPTLVDLRSLPLTFPLSGSFWGQAVITQFGRTLSCYTFTFDLHEEYDLNSVRLI